MQTDELELNYKSLEELSYYDPAVETIDLYCKGDFIDYMEVYTDKKNENREYIIINNTIVYLDTIEKLN